MKQQVTIEGSYQWVAKLKRLQPDTPLYFSIENGSHVFDQDSVLSEPWLNSAVSFAEKYWP